MPPTTFRHRIRCIVMLASLVMLASGCVKSSTVITVADDGSGTAEVILAVDSTAISGLSDVGPPVLGEPADPSEGTAQSSTVPPQQICDQAAALAVPASLPPEAAIEPYVEGELCGQRISFPFSSEEDLRTALDAVLDTDTAPGEELELRPEGDGWFFESPVISIEDTGLAETAGVPPQMTRALLADAEVVYQVTLPGTAAAGQNNATVVDGGTFIWNIDLANPPPTLFAQTGSAATGGGSSGSTTPVAVGLALAAVMALILGFVVPRRRSLRRTAPAVDDSGLDDSAGREWAATPSYGDAARGGRGRAASPDNPTVSEPWWDDEVKAWMAEHPVDGIVVYDEASGSWVPT